MAQSWSVFLYLWERKSKKKSDEHKQINFNYKGQKDRKKKNNICIKKKKKKREREQGQKGHKGKKNSMINVQIDLFNLTSFFAHLLTILAIWLKLWCYCLVFLET